MEKKFCQRSACCIFLLSFLLTVNNTIAQRNDCGTPSPKTPLFVDSVAAMHQRTQITFPLTMKIFVHILALDNGNSPAVPVADVLRQLENMRSFYAPHDICFLLTGIEQLNNSDLREHDKSEESELFPFVVPDVLNIFIHNTLTDGSEGLNGTAYGIPNTYLSVVASAVTSTDNRSTIAHEMGHLFGLYHTFERNMGVESIKRSGNCTNCTTAGDLLCDTPADPHSDSYDTGDVIDANCNYTGTASQFCTPSLLTYQMDPTNIMAYGRRSCRDHFTTGQGTRASNLILTTPILTTRIATDNVTITLSQTYSSGREVFAARNNLTIDAATFNVSNTARMYMASLGEIVIKPGASFTPTGATAEVTAAISTLCQ
jgi:hypothetical protein